MGLTNFMSVISMILFSTLGLLISGNNAQITDTDGDLLRNGGRYFIRPQDISVNGGLTITPPCPYYITRPKDETFFPGIPVTISSPLKIPFILPGLPISISFDFIIIDTCMQSLKWQVIRDESTGKSYVRTGGSDWSPDFSISESGGSYIINYKNKEDGGEVGFFEKDGLLGINAESAVPVAFKKARFNNAIAMKV